MSSAKVNRPTNTELREQSVNQKLQLYGIFSAFQNGKVPSNEQIDVALNSFQKSRALNNPSEKLSPEGKSLVADFRQVVEQAKHLFLSKNEGNLFQDFIWQTQLVDGGNAGVPGAPVDSETAKQHGNQALEGLRTLGTLLVTNGEFRKLLNDATIILRDMAGDAAEKTAGKINPSQDQLSQIDKPAEDNVWHDAPPSGSDIKDQIKSTFNQNKPLSRSDVKDVAGNTSSATQDGNVDSRTAANNAANTLQSRASENIPDDTKDKIQENKNRAQERITGYVKSKFPEERRDQVIYRLKKMVVEIQGHPDYQNAITTLLNLAEQYGGHANTIGQQSIGSVKGAHEDTALQSAEKDLKTLIERFANNTSTDNLFDAINTIYRDADQDPELKKWFKSMDTYIRKCLTQQGFIMEDAATEEWNKLYDHGNYLLRDRYRSHTDHIVDEINFLADQFNKDSMNHSFAQSMNKLFSDLGNDKDGKPTFKPHLVKDLSEVIIPAALENFGYIPIPRIEFSDPTMDVVIENLIIESDNLTPNLLELYAENTARWGRKSIANKNHHTVQLKVAGVQMDLRDVAYYIKKKQGFPGITDQGVADIFLGGSGLSFTIKMSTADKKDRQNFFKIDKVDVDVKNFDIKLRQSHHKLLFTFGKSIMLKLIRPALQKVLEKTIKDKAHELDSFLYQVKLEADRAQQEVINDPENAPNVYNRYVSAFQKKMTEGKQKTAQVQAQAENTKLNVAMTAHDSIFPNIKLPGGISTKATEYKELAAKGEKWESPVFSIGSAGKSSNIPSAGKITRKENNVSNTNGGIHTSQNDAPYGTTSGSTNGFSKHMDQAFTTGSGQNTNGRTNISTSLGQNNPVYAGTT